MDLELGAYLRKSRMEENMDTEEVLARHWAAIQELAQKRGDHIVETYKEVVSGESIFARPEMVKMLEAISDTRRKKTAIFINEKLKAAQSVEPSKQD